MVQLRDVPNGCERMSCKQTTPQIVALRDILKCDRKGHHEVVRSLRAMTGINELDVNLDQFL